MKRFMVAVLLPLAGLLIPSRSFGDGVSIDKVYDPYVQVLERELELRTLVQSSTGTREQGRQRYKLGYGQALSDVFFVELYTTTVDLAGESPEQEAVALELKWQLTEQGQYQNDWGFLFELEREHGENIWEARHSLLLQHDWRRWSGLINASFIYEWGSGVDNEVETALAARMKYRQGPSLEPAVELYWSQGTRALGPALLGSLRLGGRKKLLWSAALLAGMNDTTADINANFSLEFEF